MMCLEANVIKEAPANILAFFGHFLIKVVFLVIISISYPFSHIEIAIGILFLDFVLILLWFKYD